MNILVDGPTVLPERKGLDSGFDPLLAGGAARCRSVIDGL